MAKSIAFSFGRFNPPTIGHEKLMDKTRGANRNYRIYASQSQDPKRNPLRHKNKVSLMKGMFPAHSRKISRDKVTTALDAMVQLYKEKHTDVMMVVGSDRVAEFDALLKKYNGVKSNHGRYKFKSIRVISAGQRDPDAEGISGMSASKMRKAAQDNDYASFKQGLPTKFKQGKELFKLLRKEMGVRSIREWMEVDEASEIKFFDKKPKKKDRGPTPADQLLPKDRASRIEGFKKFHEELPPHLSKFFDKKGELKPDAAKRVAAGRKKRADAAAKPKITDVTPKGYGPSEDVEMDEGPFGRAIRPREYKAAANWFMKFKKRGDKPAIALHKAAGMVRGVNDKDLQSHLSKAKLL